MLWRDGVYSNVAKLKAVNLKYYRRQGQGRRKREVLLVVNHVKPGGILAFGPLLSTGNVNN
jgi:hypothetical protein